MITYEIRDAAGELQALHDRRNLPTGKRLAWRLPGRSTYGLEGRRVDSLPLYGSERVAGWPLDAWIIITEGESDCDALTRLDVPALGTVTGATATVDSFTAPTPDALADVAAGRRLVCWPDADAVGRGHMAVVGANLYRAGAAAVRTLIYNPRFVGWPKGAGARDFIGRAEPLAGAALVAWLLEEWSLPLGRPGPLIQHEDDNRSVVATRTLWDPGSVSAALIARGVLNAKPGRTVKCPNHHDHQASLSILADDKRAICKGSCSWSGRGVIAADVLALVTS